MLIFNTVSSNLGCWEIVCKKLSESNEKWLRYYMSKMAAKKAQIARGSKSRLPPRPKNKFFSGSSQDKIIKFEIPPIYTLLHIW